MGQEQSSPIDESTPPQTLKARSVEAVAKYILSGRAEKIVVMVCKRIPTWIPCLHEQRLTDLVAG